MRTVWHRRNLIGLSCLLVLASCATPPPSPAPDGVAPAIASIAFASSPANGDTYELGEAIEVVVEFDPAVAVTGLPRLKLNIGAETRHATDSTWVSQPVLSFPYVSEDLHPALYFRYEVQEGDHDEDGISIPANALTLNGGTIKLAADSTIDTDLTHAAVARDPTRKVSGSRASP